MTIRYIHGFGASHLTFTWLKDQLPMQHDTHFFRYSVHDSVGSCITKLISDVQNDDSPTILIGHSLGGIIAHSCASACPNVVKLVTICTPFGGVPFSGLIAMLNRSPVFSELRTHSPLLSMIRETKLAAPHLAIVGSGGIPVMPTANDGVVTVSSQTAIPDLAYHEFSLNHFEVLLSPDVAKLIHDFCSE